jgi:hypothetical protein
MSFVRWTAAPLVLLLAVSSTRAEALLPPDRPIPEVVDAYIDALLKQEQISPAPGTDDATLVRRLTLDLVGRIPTAAESASYVASTDSQKRVQLVDRLLASPGFVRHQATELATMLAFHGDGRRGDGSELAGYLLQAVREKRSWDRIFRDLILPEGQKPAQKAASEFLRPRLRDLDRLTTDVSVLFFGVNVSCAQCHDHPLVPDWKQDHFYGMKSFFSRTFDAGGALAERDYGLVKFKTAKGQERQAKLMFLTGKVVDTTTLREPSPQERQKENAQKGKRRKGKPTAPAAPVPAPKFSARAQLVELALQPGQRDFFARAIVNRVWHRLFGYGLVMPVDQMHSENPASHPELLAWLARDLVEHGYDLERLIRGLVLSQAYGRSSRWQGKETPRPSLFAVARVRPLTPVQLATSLRLAVANPTSLPDPRKGVEFQKHIENLEMGGRGFASLLEQPHDDFQIGVGEALLFTNSERVEREVLADGGDRLLSRLVQIKDGKERVAVAFQNVLSRPPTAEEVEQVAGYLKQRADRPAEAWRQVLWALLTSAEFRFNY